MSAIDKVIAVAEAEVGYLEKASNNSLDSKTANAGNKNYTKYGRDLVKWIGSPYGINYQWCDQFVDWCMIKAFGKDKAKKLLGGWSAYTPTSASFYKDMKRWHSTPQRGDQIFFRNSERICHTGIVYKVTGSYVYTIEGNTSGASGVISNGGGVCKKSYAQSNSRIAGYGRPNYALVEEKVVVPEVANGIYRLYNPNSGEHFFTRSHSEAQNLANIGWKYEGIGWKAPSTSKTPVYRVYNPNAGDHYYTTDKTEAANLVKAGWKNEGIAFYSDDAKSVPIYKQYNPNAYRDGRSGAHNFTASKAENDALVKAGWKAEGVAFYGMK